MNAAEEWRPVSELGGCYLVSDQGRILRVTGGRGAKPGRVLSPGSHPRGYLVVSLWSGGRNSMRTVHRVVAEAFLGPRNGRQVNHKNGVKTDNRVENLEWVTQGENLRHAYATGLRKPRVLTSEQARAAGRKGGVASGIARRAVSL